MERRKTFASDKDEWNDRGNGYSLQQKRFEARAMRVASMVRGREMCSSLKL